MSDEEKHGHHFDLPIFFDISKQLLGLSAECVQVSLMQTWGLQEAGSEAPQA